jgi:hypothetical protein
LIFRESKTFLWKVRQMSIEEQLRALSASLGQVIERLGTEPKALPRVLTKERAALELSISITKLNRLIRSGRLLMVQIGERQMIPSTEVERVATPVVRPTNHKETKRTPRAEGKTEAEKVFAALRLERKKA